MKYIVTLLFLFMCMCAYAQGPGQRIALINLQQSKVVESSRAGQIGLTDSQGNQRYAQYTEIDLVPISYTPTTTGNTQNFSEFVTTASGDIWYIDWQGRGIRLYTEAGAAAGDYDWLEIGNGQIPNSIRDSIWTDNYAAVNVRLVWPSAQLLVGDSLQSGNVVVLGNRNTRVGFYRLAGPDWSSIGQEGASLTARLGPGTGGFEVAQIAGTSPSQPTGSSARQIFRVNVDSTVQLVDYPRTRDDTAAVMNFLYTDQLGVVRSSPVAELPGGGILYQYKTVLDFLNTTDEFTLLDRVKINDTGAEYLFLEDSILYAPDTFNFQRHNGVFAYIQTKKATHVGLIANDGLNDSWAFQRHINFSKKRNNVLELDFGIDTFHIVNVTATNFDKVALMAEKAVFQFPQATYNTNTTRQFRLTNAKQVIINGITGDGQNRKGNTWNFTPDIVPGAAWEIFCNFGDTVQQNYAVSITNCGFVNSRLQWLRIAQTDEFPSLGGRWRKGYNNINVTNSTMISAGGGMAFRGLHNMIKVAGLSAICDTTAIFGISDASALISVTTEVTGYNYTRADVADVRVNYGMPAIFFQNVQSYNVDNVNINKGGYYLNSQGIEKRILEDFRNSPGDPYGYPNTYAVKVDNIYLAPQQTNARISNLYLTNCTSNNYGGWNIVEGSADVRISSFAVSGRSYIRTEDSGLGGYPTQNCIIENGVIDGDCGNLCVPIIASDNVIFTNVKFRPRIVNGVTNVPGVAAALGFSGNVTVQNSTWENRVFSLGPSTTTAGDTVNIMNCTFDGGYNLIQGTTDPNNELLQNTSVINITESKNVGIRYINPATGAATQYDSLAINLRNTSAYFLGQNNTTPNSLSRLLDSPRAIFDNVEIVDENGYGKVSWWPVTRAISNTTLLNALNFATSGTLTNPITVTIPEDRIKGKRVLVIEDAFGGVSGTNTITIVDAGGGTRFKRGAALFSSVIITEPYQRITLVSDGTNWTVYDSHLDLNKRWTTATRPVLGNEIVIGYNTTTARLEYWNGSSWIDIIGAISSATTGQVAFYTSSNSVGGDGNLLWDNLNKRLGFGVTPTSRFHLRGADNLAGTINFLVENSAGVSSAWATNNGSFFIGSTTGNRWTINQNGIQYTNGASIQNVTFTMSGISCPFSNLGLGGSFSLNARLGLAPGTTTIAPISFGAGTNLTVPLAGSMEWDGTRLYITNTLRRTIWYADDPIQPTQLATISGSGTEGFQPYWTGAAWTYSDKRQEAYTVVTGTGTVSASSNRKNTVINPGSTQASMTINLHPAGTPSEGQLVTLTFVNEVTALTIQSNGAAAVLGAPTTTTAGRSYAFKFYSTIGVSGTWILQQ